MTQKASLLPMSELARMDRRRFLAGLGIATAFPFARDAKAYLPLGGAAGFTPAFLLNFDALSPGASAGFNSFDFATVSNAQSFSSPNSAISTVASAGTGFGGSQSTSQTPSVGNRVWFRTAVFYPTGFNFSATPHLKLLRIDTGPIAGSTHAHLDFYLSSGGANNAGYLDWIYEGLPLQGPTSNGWMFGGSGTTPVNLASILTTGVWHYLECSYLLGLTSGTSSIKFWIDGVPIIDTDHNVPSGVATTLATLVDSSYVAGAGNVGGAGSGGGYMIHTYWNGGSPATQSAFFDNVTCGIDSVSLPVAFDTLGNRFIGTGAP